MVGKADIGAGRNQPLDDPYMPLAAVAEDDRLQQRRPAEPVDMVDVDAGGDQRFDRLDMPALGGGDEGGAAVAVDARKVRAVRERQLRISRWPRAPA